MTRKWVCCMILGFILVVTGNPVEAKDGGVCDPINGECKISDTQRPLFSLAKGTADAPITIIFYFDFLCPTCQKASAILDEVIKSYPEETRVVFKPYFSAIRPDAFIAHEAALVAAEQGQFWEMYKRLSAHRGDITREAVNGYAKEMKLDMKRFAKGMDEQYFKAEIIEEGQTARGFGVATAPTFFVNGHKLVGARPVSDFQRIIDKELGKTVAVLENQVPIEAPSLLASDIDIHDAPVLGPSSAPVVIVEFSDFQCPFCAKGLPTLQEIRKRYPTQVRWAFKHFPLDFHADAPLAHRAALAAGEQGKFWEMHGLIFANQNTMKREDLLRYAKEIKLDNEKFLAALDSNRLKTKVTQDVEEGQRLGVSGTPTTFINGKRLVGAQPIGSFISVIENQLRLGKVGQ